MPRPPRTDELNPRLFEFRQQRRLTQEQVAEAIGISVEMVRRHEKGLAQPIEKYRLRYSSFYGVSQATLGLMPPTAVASRTTAHAAINASLEIDQLVAEISESGTSSESIDRLAEATADLAELHTETPARALLKQVLQLRSTAHELTCRRIRLSQARELYRIESDLLAHSCLLLGDVNQDDLAYKHGTAALSFAAEAGSNEAIARSALAKTLRWADRLIESANMARSGYASSPATPTRVQLASQEANAAALLGDGRRAWEALSRAEEDASTCEQDSGKSAWSFSTGRRAIFALSVATQTGDPAGALRAAALADVGWRAGEPLVKANWAQIRIGAAIARLDSGDLEGAIAEVTPVLDLAPELRIATVTAYMRNLTRRLNDFRIRDNTSATFLRDDIRAFTLEALPREPQQAS